MCGKYPLSDVLPDEDDNCSLCGSALNASGECLYLEPDKDTLSMMAMMARTRPITKYIGYGEFNARKHKATCDKNRRKRKNKKR
jgi:hypothetical protein